MVFIVIVIIIIIIKFEVEQHFLIKALTEENITTTAFPSASRVAGKVAVTPEGRYYLFISSTDTLRKTSNYIRF